MSCCPFLFPDHSDGEILTYFLHSLIINLIINYKTEIRKNCLSVMKEIT